MQRSIYDAAGGAEVMRRIAATWHRLVMADPVVAHAFHGGVKPDHVDRLAAYLGEAIGGPARYTTSYGAHVEVVRLHSGDGEHDEMNRRAIECFADALRETGIDTDPETYQAILDYWSWSTWHSMGEFDASADDVPAELPMPHWQWDGLVTRSEA